MATISISKKKSRLPKKPASASASAPKEVCSCVIVFFKFLYRIPAAFLLLFLIYLWSSSATIISGNIVHICVSSRKLNEHYCLSAGKTLPNFEIPIPIINESSIYLQTPDPNSNLPPLPLSASTDFYQKEKDSSISTLQSADIVKNLPPFSLSSSNNLYRKEKDSSISTLHSTDIMKNREEEVAIAKKEVEEQIRMHRSWISDKKQEGCEGRGVYVYDLPSKFNKDLVGQCSDKVPSMDFCNYFKNEAMGEPIPKLGNGWYQTHQYSLEPIFHQRVLKHPCRVYHQNEAKLFYIPFYGGLDILRWHFKNVSNDVKDTLSLELITWLEKQKSWAKNSGKDHVIVLGKISWDFRRKDGSWGTRLLEIEQMKNPIKLLIERQPWQPNDIGIPHPTYFHPKSDDDIMAWQWKIISSFRPQLVSFAGAARPGAAESIRSTLIKQCNSSTDNGNQNQCRFLDCGLGGCDQPGPVIDLFLESEFCLQPPGDSPTRKSLFDSLISGCIPVLFDPFTAYYQYPWHLPEDHGKYSVFVDQEEVRQGKVNVVEMLMKISKEERENMRRFIVYELFPGLVYGDSNAKLERFQDAFSITMGSLMERVIRLVSTL